MPVFKIKAWRRAGKPLPEVLQLYQSVHADLNVLPYCSQFIPMEVISFPKLHSICYHPSILPRHRGASSINWTLIAGDKRAGLTIFWADDGLDTGPILLQEMCPVDPNDTVDSLYKRFLFPVGVDAVARAVDMVADGTAPKIAQSDVDATYDPMLNKLELQKIDWSRPAGDVHNFIRGMDSVPGATCLVTLPDSQPQRALLFGSTLWEEVVPGGVEINVDGAVGVVHDDGLLVRCGDGRMVNVKRVKVAGKIRPGSSLCHAAKQAKLVFTDEERETNETVRKLWEGILKIDVDDETDFFEAGAGSMDVVRLVEEVKDACKVELENEDVFMASTFSEFVAAVVVASRGTSGPAEIEYRAVELVANKMTLRFPCQLFINGEFVDAEYGKTMEVVNPSDESCVCHVQFAGPGDVGKAVRAAKRAFEAGEWSKISARERGELLFR